MTGPGGRLTDRDGALRRAGRLLVVRSEERRRAEAGGERAALLAQLTLLPHPHLQQVEQLLSSAALEGVNTRADSLPPRLETEEPILQSTALTRVTTGGGRGVYLEAISLEILQRPPDWLLPLQVENEISLCYLQMSGGQLNTILREKSININT